MNLSLEEVQKLSTLFLSSDDANTKLAFDIMKPYGFIPELLTEVFVVFKTTTIKKLKDLAAQLLKAHASPNIQKAMTGKIKLNSENTIKKNISKYVELSNQELDGLKLGRAIYNKYDLGFAYLMKEAPSNEIKTLLESHIQGTTCNLHGKGLKSLPKEFFEFTDLEEIDLSNNYIANINKSFSVFTKLRKFNLRGNSLKKMHDSLAALDSLEELDLDNNLITEIPKVLANFKSLRRLSMINMLSMKAFGDVASMPENFAQLRLQYLALANKTTNRFQYDYNLPQVSILETTGDDYLDLTPIGMAKHSFELGEKTAIRYLLLYAESDYRKKVLASIYDATTKTMDLTNLALYGLPPELNAFDIRILNLKDARLGYKTTEEEAAILFSPIGTLSTLEQLNLSYNGLDKFPSALFKCKNLRALSLNGNSITSIPPEIKELQQLEFLSLRSSKHSKPIDLPEELSSLKKLNTIYIAPLYHAQEAVYLQNATRIKELLGNQVEFDQSN